MAPMWCLEKRGALFYCVRDVPRRLRATMGRRKMVASLHTHDLATAQSLRTVVLAAFERAFAEAERAVRPSPVMDSTMAWRETFEALHRGDVPTVRALGVAAGWSGPAPVRSKSPPWRLR